MHTVSWFAIKTKKNQNSGIPKSLNQSFFSAVNKICQKRGHGDEWDNFKRKFQSINMQIMIVPKLKTKIGEEIRNTKQVLLGQPDKKECLFYIHIASTSVRVTSGYAIDEKVYRWKK
jgi:hypothetical protein